MTADIVDRLTLFGDLGFHRALGREAAAEIVRLRAALRGSAEMLAVMGNGDGITINDIIEYLEAAAAGDTP